MADLAPEERDILMGLMVPKNAWNFIGAQYAESLDPVRDKKPTPGPPIMVGVGSPGTVTNDAQWKRTYASSSDALLSLVRGQQLKEIIDSITLADVYKDGTFNIDLGLTWKPAGGIQQVKYIASKDTLNEASQATESHGDLSELRGIGLRMPTVMGGWGRTVDGLPTDPNPGDHHRRLNDEEHKLARETWKYGPIDFRWDPRRGVWAAYNDLIEDHYNTKLGTWVFGTNNDSSQGFPFLRGRLNDFLWVRQTMDYHGADGTSEGVQTGSAMIHLKTRLFDEDEDGSALLEKVFIIPHTENFDENTHPKGEEATLGDEVTGQDENIDIRTEVHFFAEKGKCGKIDFGEKASEVEMCCKPGGSKYFVGKMLFMDEEPEGCSGGTAGTTVNSISPSPVVISSDLGAPQDYRWAPAIRIDECELMGNHLVKLISNDAVLGTSIGAVCNGLAAWSTTVSTAASAGFASLSASVSCLNNELVGVVAATNAQLDFVDVQAYLRALTLAESTNSAIASLVQQINFALAACNCPYMINGPVPVGFSADDHGTEPIVFNPCPGGGGLIPPYDCGSCPSITIQGVCTNEETYDVATPCASTVTATTITTEFGTCQNHDSA